MKKFLSVVLIAAISFAAVSVSENANAQSTKKVTNDTVAVVGTNYITFTAVGSHLKCLQATVVKVSGTVAGTVILQATVDGSNWQTVASADTLTLTNVATQTHLWPVSHTSYTSYRFAFITTGTNSVVINAAYLRRTDEE